MTKSTSFISTSIKAPPSVKPTDEQGTFTTPQKKLLTASASGGEGEASYDINPTQKIWKQSERLTETGRSPEKKYTIETKQKRRLDAYSSQRVASVFAGEAIAQQMDTIEPETTESTPQESQEMSSGEEEVSSNPICHRCLNSFWSDLSFVDCRFAVQTEGCLGQAERAT